MIPSTLLQSTHETKRTDLGGKGGRGTDLTTDGTEVDDLGLVMVWVGDDPLRRSLHRVFLRVLLFLPIPPSLPPCHCHSPLPPKQNIYTP